MYVCLCNALTDRDVARAAGAGARAASDVFRANGCKPQCGKCLPFMRECLAEHRCEGSAGATVLLPAVAEAS